MGYQGKQLKLWTNSQGRQGHRDIWFINKGVGRGEQGTGGKGEDWVTEPGEVSGDIQPPPLP